MPSPHIRRARDADEAELARLDREVWSPLHAVMPPPEPAAPFFDDRHIPEHYLVAEEPESPTGGILGYVRLIRPVPFPAGAHVRQIQGLAVADRARGRGLGRALVRAALAEARRQGATRITLHVLGPNTPARKLYEAEGFEVEGVRPGEFWIEGAYVDDVLMGRPL